ncbi:MAG: hypothetical protein H6842_07105 [Rhodospirillaceae bacterium]|nr:hypothetical protein [Rhodospirillaceae bacterium]
MPLTDNAKLGDILLAKGLATEADIARAMERQRQHGGVLGQNLVALEVISQKQLDAVLNTRPRAPRTVEETGLPLAQLLKMMLKCIYAQDLRTASEMRDCLALPFNVVMKLVEEATEQKLLAALGQTGGIAGGEMSYQLSEAGRRLAKEAQEQNGYVGPAPVSLQSYQQRIIAQKIGNERVDQARVEAAFSDMVVTDQFIQSIGPAINSGKSILLYGPPGNGKTSLAERIGKLFEGTIYVPHAVDIDGSIVKVFDPSIHQPVTPPGTATGAPAPTSVVLADVDHRWVACKRPLVMVGGELTLQMLDLEFNAISKFYEAPIHLKALGGTFLIDDFGRQLVKPVDLLNRWIVPLESRFDFMKLHSGRTFSVPFDELVVFATNLNPSDLMDPAFLRRIPYKLETVGPSQQVFRQIFRIVAGKYGLEPTDEVVEFVIDEITKRNGEALAGYQPRFICEHVINACKFKGVPAHFTLEEVREGLGHLIVKGGGKRANMAQAA